MADIENNKERFLDIVNKYIKRDGIENLVSYLERSVFSLLQLLLDFMKVMMVV